MLGQLVECKPMFIHLGMLPNNRFILKFFHEEARTHTHQRRRVIVVKWELLHDGNKHLKGGFFITLQMQLAPQIPVQKDSQQQTVWMFEYESQGISFYIISKASAALRPAAFWRTCLTNVSWSCSGQGNSLLAPVSHAMLLPSPSTHPILRARPLSTGSSKT